MSSKNSLTDEQIIKKLNEAKSHERNGELGQRNKIGWYLLGKCPQFFKGYREVETWYFRAERSYVTQIKDQRGNQIGESDYSGNREDAAACHLFALWNLFEI